RDLGQPSALLLDRPEQGDRARAKTLHCEGEIREAIMPREDLSAQREAAHIGLGLAIRYAELEEPGAAVFRHERTAGCVRISRMLVLEPLLAPSLQLCGE